MSILNYQNLTLTYNEQEILHHIDLMIPKNQITVIVGQSGSGKSTLLKATMGLLSDDDYTFWVGLCHDQYAPRVLVDSLEGLL